MPAECEEAKVFTVNLVDFSTCVKDDKSNKKSDTSPEISYSCLSQLDSSCQETLIEECSHTNRNGISKQTILAESVKDIAVHSTGGAVYLKMESKMIHFDSLVFGGKYAKKSIAELEVYSGNELKSLLSGLSKAVEEISNQLVQLLLENDNLQQESDARNVAIEQLLKITVKVTETESKPVQMSVILSPEESEDI